MEGGEQGEDVNAAHKLSSSEPFSHSSHPSWHLLTKLKQVMMHACCDCILKCGPNVTILICALMIVVGDQSIATC